MHLQVYNYRFANEVLDSPPFEALKKDIFSILEKAPMIELAKPKIRERKDKNGKITIHQKFTTDQKAINSYLDNEFAQKDWEVHPRVIPEKGTNLVADYKKARVQIEVQFGNMARWYTDIFKFQLSYSMDKIDVGILCVPTLVFAETIDENVAYFERVCRELPHAKMSITLPILVIGLSP
jgi:hypothetical protein